MAEYEPWKFSLGNTAYRRKFVYPHELNLLNFQEEMVGLSMSSKCPIGGFHLFGRTQWCID